MTSLLPPPSPLGLPLSPMNHSSYPSASSSNTTGAGFYSPSARAQPAQAPSESRIVATEPPAYHSITSKLAGTTTGLEGQAVRNQEKQAIRDHQLLQDSLRERLHDPTLPQVRYDGPRSVEPSSNGSDGVNGTNGQVRTSMPPPGLDVGHAVQFESNGSQEHGGPVGFTLQSYDSGSGSTDSTLGYRGLLPPGMDVQQALQQCEDPTLGWSLQFWVTIADPVTQHVFFANPASGQCSWEPPVGAFVVPRSTEGEWWELADASRGNRSYYYNTLSGKTQWTRPGGDAFVIPLGLIQNNSLPNRGSVTPTRANFLAAPQHSPSHSNRSPRSRRSRHPDQGISPSITTTLLSAASSSSHYPGQPHTQSRSSSLRPGVSSNDGHLPSVAERPLSEATLPSDPSTITNQSLIMTPPTKPNGITHSPISPTTSTRFKGLGASDEGELSDTGSDGSWWERRKSIGIGKLRLPKKNSGGAIRPSNDQALKSKASPLRQNTAIVHSGDLSSPLREANPVDEPMYVQPEVKTKRFSTGLHPLLPPDIANDITSFQTSSFASKFFATKRTGFLRSKIPIHQILTHQSSPISSPLLNISRHLFRDSVMTFKVIQHVMGERSRIVEGANANATRTEGAMSTSQSALSMVALGKGRKGDEGDIRRGGRLANGFSHSMTQINERSDMNGNGNGSGTGHEIGVETSQKVVVLEEIRWMILVAVTNTEMRDEVYAQLIKQLTKNPDHEAVVLGYQLFCVFVLAFGPSKEFTSFVRNFLKLNKSRQDDGVGVMANYCLAKLEVMSNKGGRGKALTIGEIEHASDAAFYPSIYGESIETIMALQERSYPELKIPIVLPFLADGILALGGMSSEGIFRVPGDNDSIFELKSRIDRGHYQLNGIDDPHVAASLFKLWLRELENPVVPMELYNDALVASRSPDECVKFIGRLPTYNRRVLLFVISFFQLFMKSDVLEITKMTAQNLALVLAPNVLRTTSDSLVTVFTNSTFESKFVFQLLNHLKPDTVDPEYVPVHGQPAGRESIATDVSGTTNDGLGVVQHAMSNGH